MMEDSYLSTAPVRFCETILLTRNTYTRRYMVRGSSGFHSVALFAYDGLCFDSSVRSRCRELLRWEKPR
jgi:hypothetical protein